MKRRNFLIGAGAATAAAIGAGAVVFDRHSDQVTTRRYGDVSIHRRPPQADAPDVLFIALDDCNDWVGFLGNHPGTVTPNLDALAAESLSFDHAYCTAPMCVPARTSVMFGRAPYETGVYDHAEPSDERYAALVRSSSALVDDFWAAGYDVVSGGKVFGDSQRGRWTQFHRTPIDVVNPNWTSPYTGRPIGPRPRDLLDFGPSGISPAAEPDGDDDHVGATPAHRSSRSSALPGLRPDQHPRGVARAAEVLRHAPDRRCRRRPSTGPTTSTTSARRAEALIDSRTLDSLRDAGIWAEAVQAYQAAMSYADDRLGIVLDALARSPRADDTIVVVWSDHGFHLGEKLHWHKFTLWERATHVPMLFRVPGTFDSGAVFDRPVSAMDIGPTLADFAGVELRTPQSGSTPGPGDRSAHPG